MFLFGGMAAVIRPDLGFDERTLGFLVGGYFGAASISSAVLGRAVGAMGARRGAVLSLVVVGVASLGIATLATSPRGVLPFLMLAGLANGSMQPAANLAISRRIPTARQGIAFGIKQAAIPIATLLAGLALPIIALTVGWRWAYGAVAIAVPAIVLGVLRHFPGRDAEPSARAGVEMRSPARRRAASPLAGFRGRLSVLAVAGALGSGAANALGAFLVDSAVSAGVAAASAGLLLSAGSIGAIAARLGAGWAADRTRLDLNVLIAAMMALGGFAYILIPVALAGPSRWVVVLVAFVGCLGWAGIYQLSVVRQHFDAAAAATGFTQAGMYAGGLLGPIIFGTIAASAGYALAWRAAGAAAVIAAVLVLAQWVVTRERAPQRPQAQGSAWNERPA